MKMANEGMRKKIRVLARKLNFNNEIMYEVCGTDSLRKLTHANAIGCIEAMEKQLALQGIPNIPPGRVSTKQRGKIAKYRHLLEWHPAHFWNWAKRVIGHDLPKGSDYYRFNWITPSEGNKLVQGLQAIYEKQRNEESASL